MPVTAAELREAATAYGNRPADPLLRARASAGVRLVTREHADPALTLSYVVWPTDATLEAQGTLPR